MNVLINGMDMPTDCAVSRFYMCRHEITLADNKTRQSVNGAKNRNMILGIIIGLFIGGCVGVVVMAIMQMAKDDDIEQREDDENA